MIDVDKYRRMIADSTPGKFEGEPPETAYYYDRMMDGDGEFVDDSTTAFHVSADEAKAFGLSTNDLLILESSDSGFWHTYQVALAELDRYIDSILYSQMEERE